MTITFTYATYGLVQGEAMVDASREGDQVPFVHEDPNPSVLLVPDVKVGPAVQDVADLIVQMQVLLKEHLQLRGQTEILISHRCEESSPTKWQFKNEKDHL